MSVKVRVTGANKRAAEIDEAIVVATEQVLRERTGRIFDDARAEWPRDSGESAQGLRNETNTKAQGVRSGISGEADYTPHVQVRGVNQWKALVRDPMNEQAPDVAREVASAVAKRAD